MKLSHVPGKIAIAGLLLFSLLVIVGVVQRRSNAEGAKAIARTEKNAIIEEDLRGRYVSIEDGGLSSMLREALLRDEAAARLFPGDQVGCALAFIQHFLFAYSRSTLADFWKFKNPMGSELSRGPMYSRLAPMIDGPSRDHDGLLEGAKLVRDVEEFWRRRKAGGYSGSGVCIDCFRSIDVSRVRIASIEDSNLPDEAALYKYVRSRSKRSFLVSCGTVVPSRIASGGGAIPVQSGRAVFSLRVMTESGKISRFHILAEFTSDRRALVPLAIGIEDFSSDSPRILF
jgi:hypothetical protein